MSMRDYPVYDYGLILDEEAIKHIAKRIFSDFSEDEDIFSCWGFELYSEGLCEYVANFTGEAQAVNEDGIVERGCDHIAYYDEEIVYVPMDKYPFLFKKAYGSFTDIIKELKGKVGQYLPENFDYRNNIRHIVGTYYG